MQRVLDAVQWAWVLTIWVAFVCLWLFLLLALVGWYWPCEWAWQPFGGHSPFCTGGYSD